MACPHCGSWAVKADRSLAGRLVCGRCGRPLGPGAARRSSSSGPFRRGGSPRRRAVWLWLGGLLAVSALLAWMAEPRSRGPAVPRRAVPWSLESPADFRPWR